MNGEGKGGSKKRYIRLWGRMRAEEAREEVGREEEQKQGPRRRRMSNGSKINKRRKNSNSRELAPEQEEE